MSTLKPTPSSKRITIGLDPLYRSMALTVCVSTPSVIFARISGNHSRRLPEFSVSGKYLSRILQRCPSGEDPFKLPSCKGILDSFPITGPQNISALEQPRRLIGTCSKLLDYWGAPWRIRVSRVGPTSQLISNDSSSCSSFFPLSLLFLTTYYLVMRCHSSLCPTESPSFTTAKSKLGMHGNSNRYNRGALCRLDTRAPSPSLTYSGSG